MGLDTPLALHTMDMHMAHAVRRARGTCDMAVGRAHVCIIARGVAEPVSRDGH